MSVEPNLGILAVVSKTSLGVGGMMIRLHIDKWDLHHEVFYVSSMNQYSQIQLNILRKRP